MIHCWKCGKEIHDLPKKISFRELCPHCQAYLHNCKNCRHYHQGFANNCKIPGTDLIRDREASNFCEDFEMLGKPPEKTADPKDVLKRLFGDD